MFIRVLSYHRNKISRTFLYDHLKHIPQCVNISLRKGPELSKLVATDLEQIKTLSSCALKEILPPDDSALFCSYWKNIKLGNSNLVTGYSLLHGTRKTVVKKVLRNEK